MDEIHKECLREVRRLIRLADFPTLEAVLVLLEERLEIEEPKPVGAPRVSRISYEEIRFRRFKGESLTTIAKDAGISRQRVSAICAGELD